MAPPAHRPEEASKNVNIMLSNKLNFPRTFGHEEKLAD
jgi:hypothetical protein